jgi:ribosomal protein S18 acetylase RimI-like enzyme
MPAPDEAALDFLRQLEQSVSLAPATDAEAVVNGPFRAFFSPFTAEPQLNYAMPIALPEAPDGFVEALAALRQVFASRQRRLRLEFTEELWPSLAQAARQAGLDLVEREPLMICRPVEFQPAPPSGVSVALLTAQASDETLTGFARLRAEVFDDAPPPGVESLLRLRQAVQADHDWYALATLDGRFVGSGRCDASGNGWGEITAIVTHPDFRQRGVAAAVTSLLVRQMIDSGSTLAWLSAANPTAQRVYARLGFRIVGNLLNYEEPART